MTDLEKGISLIAKKLSYINSLKNASLSYTSKEFKESAEALEGFINLIDKREDLIEKCKDIDIKLDSLNDLNEIKSNETYTDIQNKISSAIKETIDNETNIKDMVSRHRKTLGNDMAQNKNSQKLLKKYFASPDMVEGYFLNKRQ